MNLHSLKSKITLIFLIASILFAILFTMIVRQQKREGVNRLIQKEVRTARYLDRYYQRFGTIDKEGLHSFNYRILADKQEIKRIRVVGELVRKKLIRQKKSRINLQLYRLKDRYYLHLRKNKQYNLWMEEKDAPARAWGVPAALLLVFALMVSMYAWIMQSLKPLEHLRKEINRYSRGESDINCQSDKKDEVAQVSNAFDQAAKKIHSLLQSRQLFLRSIMHELKTPIAKGKLIAEIQSDPQSKKALQKIFNRQNQLIDTFAQMERISTQSLQTKMSPYSLQDLIRESIDMLMLDDEEKHINLALAHDHTIYADRKLFCLCIKNLLDNAIRYSPDHFVEIILNDNLTIRNNGDPLKYQITDFYTPFRPHSNGTGMGLYIAKSVVDIHGFRLGYSYTGEQHLFMIEFTH